MKNLSTWLLTIFTAMFSIFRIMVVIKTQQGDSLEGVVSNNIVIEIGLIFLTLICLLFIIKRKMIGAIVYAASYTWFFGTELYSMFINPVQLGMGEMLSLLSSAIGVLIPLMVLFDMTMDKSRKISPKHKQTDWFYKNEQFDRKFDERADRNEYKF